MRLYQLFYCLSIHLFKAIFWLILGGGVHICQKSSSWKILIQSLYSPRASHGRNDVKQCCYAHIETGAWRKVLAPTEKCTGGKPISSFSKAGGNLQTGFLKLYEKLAFQKRCKNLKQMYIAQAAVGKPVAVLQRL